MMRNDRNRIIMINNDYILTKHAKQRMKERGISEEEVESVLKKPNISIPGQKGEMKVEKTIKRGRRIRVIYKKERKAKIILTAILV
jgi:hypothetical protein